MSCALRSLSVRQNFRPSLWASKRSRRHCRERTRKQHQRAQAFVSAPPWVRSRTRCAVRRALWGDAGLHPSRVHNARLGQQGTRAEGLCDALFGTRCKSNACKSNAIPEGRVNTSGLLQRRKAAPLQRSQPTSPTKVRASADRTSSRKVPRLIRVSISPCARTSPARRRMDGANGPPWARSHDFEHCNCESEHDIRAGRTRSTSSGAF